MSSLTPLLKTTTLLAASSSAFLSGYAFAANSYALPALALAPPPLRAQQWNRVYSLGALVSPPLTAVAALLWAHAAYALPAKRVALGVAAAVTAGNVVWTLLAIAPTNGKLLELSKKVAKKEVVDDAEVTSLVDKWGNRSAMRVVFPMVGAMVGLWALL